MTRTATVVVVGMLVAAAAAISMRSAFAQGAITADLILSNGKIVTVDDRFTIAQAVAIKGNRIARACHRQDGRHNPVFQALDVEPGGPTSA